jgi:hypothetical protein
MITKKKEMLFKKLPGVSVSFVRHRSQRHLTKEQGYIPVTYPVKTPQEMAEIAQNILKPSRKVLGIPKKHREVFHLGRVRVIFCVP